MTTSSGTRGLLIGGSWVEGAGGGYEVRNPATEAVVGVAPEATAEDARAAAAAAAEAFPAWSRTAPEERAALLDKVGDLLEARMADLVPLVQAETGSNPARALAYMRSEMERWKPVVDAAGIKMD